MGRRAELGPALETKINETVPLGMLFLSDVYINNTEFGLGFCIPEDQFPETDEPLAVVRPGDTLDLSDEFFPEPAVDEVMVIEYDEDGTDAQPPAEDDDDGRDQTGTTPAPCGLGSMGLMPLALSAMGLMRLAPRRRRRRYPRRTDVRW